MTRWVNAEERLPKNQEHKPCNEYHVVKYQYDNNGSEHVFFGEDKPVFALSKAIAMYMRGEWWINYHAKLMYPVKFWLEDDNED